MKLSQIELVSVGLIILYVAFFSHPPPSHIKDFLSSPVGHAVFLAAILYVTVYKSLIVGVFLGIAYVMTAASTIEYLDPKEQKPKDKEQPKSAGVPPATSSLKDILGKLQKGDSVAHKAVAGKSDTAPPPATATPKPAAPKTQGTLTPVH
uniref:Uncharacterized protein n=1 Tax=viral metagenome TaxID=1070528 RepID=A0A6C0CHM9_9ZZZZ